MKRNTHPLTIACLLLMAAHSAAAAAGDFCLVVDKPLPLVSRQALDELRQALQDQGHTVRENMTPPDNSTDVIFVGIASESPLIDRELKTSRIELSTAAESLTVRRIDRREGSLLVAGRDARGLAYALRDVIRTVKVSTRDEHPFTRVIQANESPTLKVRNVSVHLFNADLERGWYFEDEFWRDYFRMLSLHRFNHFTLTFSDQTNYLCPLYSYLVEMPEYPQVHVEGLKSYERKHNLIMLGRIAELADEHGIDFNLGIWMQAPVPRWSAPVRVTGLPEGLKLAKYCSLGLRRVLEECPAIRGVQLRMNDEAGVPAEQQTEFYRPIFQAIRAVGRPVRIDLRYKGLQPSTTQAALDEKLDVTVSTKFWAEHFGLPYHPTSVDSHWREDRYSFGAMLKQPRSCRVVYQLWNVGSQRLTIWGDPEYARRFAESCQLGGGEGFEVFAPLTNQGYGDRPGPWRAIRDPTFRVGHWDQERYWCFYLCFGRMGYNPKTSTEVSQREFRHRFGESAADVERAYRAASQILPLITAARLPGASEWSWWPEMDTGGKLREYMHIQPSDPRQFYAIRSWKRTLEWRWEEWDESSGYAEDVLAGKLRGKWTPPMIAQRLQMLAQQIDTACKTVSARRQNTPESRMTEVDLKVLAELARFHAAKLQAATHLAFYELADQPGRLPVVRRHVLDAIASWRRIVELTTPVYHEDLVFGIASESPRSKFGHHHTGHWRDRLVEVEADLHYVDGLIAHHGDRAVTYQPFPDEQATRPQVRLSHDEVRGHLAGTDLQVQVNVADAASSIRMKLYHRPLDQTRDWRELEMTKAGNGSFVAMIPADQIDSHFDLQYYFELLNDHGGMLWPSWEEGQPYVVVPVKSAK